MSTAAAAPNGRHLSSRTGDKVVRIDRAEAASIALKVAINDRVGRTSPKWMVDVAEQMGVRRGRD